MRRLFVFLGLLCALSPRRLWPRRRLPRRPISRGSRRRASRPTRPRPPSSRPTAVDRVARGPVRLGGWAVRYSGVSMSGDVLSRAR